uniref:Galectin n=1 Tax=Meloidogyne incognita TaxID=6306 RepID=A0A914KH77_MELIC
MSKKLENPQQAKREKGTSLTVVLLSAVVQCRSIRVNTVSTDPFSFKDGVTVLLLNFVFDPEEYQQLGKNFTYTQGNNSVLYIKSYRRSKGGWGINQTHKNPIGHTDVPVTIQIIAGEHYFNISINGATDYIHYYYVIPPWTINYAMVTGNIQNVKFLESTSKKCLKVKEYKLPSNMAKTDKRLVQGDQIIIKGQVPNPFNETTITVCLMHRALEVTEHIGENIYILYIYSNYSDNTAFVGGDWSHKDQYNKDTASNSVNLNGGERIRISINFQSDDKIKPIVETEEHTIQDTIEYSCSSEYSYDLIEYIQVRELSIFK